MTATLTLASKDIQAGRNAGYCPAPHDALGTTIQRNTPGQLWERVAERSEQTYRYVWHGGMPPGPRVCEPKGAWILGRHVCPRRESHGIIRAGERIK